MSDMFFREKAWEELLYWDSHDRRITKRIHQLLRDIARGGHEGIGKPERLKGNLSGLWSRRIDGTNRLIYRVQGETVEVLSCKGHYED